VGGAELSKLIKDVSDAGAKVYKEGRKMVDDALENAEAQVDEFAKKTATTVKKSAAKSTATKTSAVKTSAAKTSATKKTTARKTS
jgi:polyhydroxyalkanoate synthesis regulator phasin